MTDAIDTKALIAHAKNIRRTIVEMIYRAKCSHIGCSLSAADILTALYFGVLRLDPLNPNDPNRDRLIMSKGHGVAALYATLAERGFFARDELDLYGTDGTRLANHVVRNALPGMETSNGSGGHGLSLGIGMAIAVRNAGNGARVFVVSGDGELEEGSVWEALLFGSHHQLANVTMVVDQNGMQSEGSTETIVDIEPLADKFHAFGWDVAVINGHDFTQLIPAMRVSGSRPRVVIAKTTKGKGVSYMENKWQWHNGSPNDEQYKIAMEELL